VNRRLADKILDAVQHALTQGREEIAQRLDLIYQALCEDDEYLENKRRIRMPDPDLDPRLNPDLADDLADDDDENNQS